MQTTSFQTVSSSTTKTGTRAEILTGALLAAMLGIFLVWGVGFAPIPSVHNAAHDTRHASGFPCH